MQHPQRMQVSNRSLSSQERAWVREIVQHHPLWSNVDVSDMQIVAQCGCGDCRTVYLDSEKPQNSFLKGTRGYIGRIEVRTTSDFGITITLDQRDGKLEELYVNYVDLSEDGCRPFPQDWQESAHVIEAM